jgi:hypothetical protein
MGTTFQKTSAIFVYERGECQYSSMSGICLWMKT